MAKEQLELPSVTRRHALSALAGTGLALAAMPPLAAFAAAPTADASCSDSDRDVVNTLLLIERLAITFYYVGLTTPVIGGNRKVTGMSGNMGKVPLRSDPGHVSCLKAALTQEHEHARLLEQASATSSVTRFHFPRSTFADIGYTSHPSVFLWVMDHIETTAVGAYLAAVRRLGALGQHDMAMLSVRIVGTECEHRALGRVIAQDTPVNNVTLEVVELSCLHDARTALTPFLTGHGFQERATIAVPVPSEAQIDRITRHVRGLN